MGPVIQFQKILQAPYTGFLKESCFLVKFSIRRVGIGLLSHKLRGYGRIFVRRLISGLNRNFSRRPVTKRFIIVVRASGVRNSRHRSLRRAGLALDGAVEVKPVSFFSRISTAFPKFWSSSTNSSHK